ncbi:unnamed protein product [Orchesella dallaii]|uniref:Major facilitator superfamily (MFS) profile domain-containing protein n=1 Tax=Orchesella dallaii TaxID=48710 RepID=A0ABP1S6V5_9HEXA
MSEVEENNQILKLKLSPSNHRTQYFVCGILCLGGFLGGIVTGWSSTSIPSLEISGHFSFNSNDLSWIASIGNLGIALSAITTGYMIKFGRKTTLLFSALPYLIGWAALAFPTDIWMLYAGRLLTGLADGKLMIAGSIYLSESVDPILRGRLSVVLFLSIRLGILFAYGVGSLLPYNHLSVIPFIVSAIFGASFIFLPESPRWLMTKWRVQEATDTLCWLQACDKSSPTLEILKEIDEIKDAVIRAGNEGHKQIISTYFTHRALKATLIVCILMVFREASGGNVFGYFVVQTFDETGSAFDSHLSGVIVGVAQMLSILITVYYVDRIGRRVLLIQTFIIMSISLAILGLFSQFKTYIEDTTIFSQFSGWIPLILFVIYNAANSGGPFVLAFTLFSEIVPTNVIGFVSGISMLLGFITSFVLARYYEDMNIALGISSTFWIYAVFCTLGAIIVHLLVPETALKTLENIHMRDTTTEETAIA